LGKVCAALISLEKGEQGAWANEKDVVEARPSGSAFHTAT
jgi:hypothetical protein